jgi:hypothetical protein
VNPTAATALSYTPPGLVFDEPLHRYTHDGKVQVSVTAALDGAGLIDRRYFTDEARTRGALVAAAIALWHEHERMHAPAIVEPYLRAYRSFLAESAIRIDACEERVCDPLLGCAGTLDLRGVLPPPPAIAAVAHVLDAIDVIDVKTGSVPTFVGWQVAGYVRLLPPGAARRCRRWCLHLRDDATYRLLPLTRRTDEQVFLAAVTIAQAKRGWL